MKKIHLITLALAALIAASCGQKKKSDDIIVRKVETPKPKEPIRMQVYDHSWDVKWLGKDYQVTVNRTPDDSLSMVKDETGQKFVDNRITLRIVRSDGSVFFSRTFTKAAFESQLDNDYRQTGILEGLVFDKAEGAQLHFAASVCHPQADDEYIPFIVTVSNQGEVGIKSDTSLDTYGTEQTN